MSEYGATCQTMDSANVSMGRVNEGPLCGTFEHALDPKKRITIPSVWREVMGSPVYLYVMVDPHDPCLTVVPPDALLPRLQRMRQGPLFDEGQTEALRDLFEDAEYLAVDVQGRIRIGDELLAFAQLDDLAVLRGVGVRIQVWSSKRRPRRTGIDQTAVANAARILNF
jgi:MraZ protein